ncbi:MAG: hypothetical protein IKO56_03385 [Alphaproteobacteria bacterium]|nr:hypothetical protein [Alphaproteobacteria bacterium]
MLMRKIFTLIFALLNVTFSFAQEHLTFKGVPIDGTLSSYVTKMKAKGFISYGSSDGVAILKGDFAAHKSCTIAVATMQNRDLVSRIGVMFPEQSQWQYLYGDYSELKKLLTIKYGEPTECLEEFQCDRYSYPDDDNDRMHNVRMDRCKYASVFTTNNGSIELSIAHGEYSSCFVKLLYIDKTNNDSVIQDALDDL